MGTTTTTSGYRQLIGGEWRDGSDGTYEIINPATEEVVAEAPEASADDVRAATQAAADAFPAWSRTDPASGPPCSRPPASASPSAPPS